MSKKFTDGFSLIELMISLTIIGIIVAIAVPSYSEHVRKARRSAAMGAIEKAASAMERYRLQNNTYVGAVVTPFNTEDYALTIVASTINTYTLRATPNRGPDGFIELLSSGQQRWDEDNNGIIDLGPGLPPFDYAFDNNNWTSEK